MLLFTHLSDRVIENVVSLWAMKAILWVQKPFVI